MTPKIPKNFTTGPTLGPRSSQTQPNLTEFDTPLERCARWLSEYVKKMWSRGGYGPARAKIRKKKYFLGPIFDFLGPFLGRFGPDWALSWWEPWARVPKGPRIAQGPNPEKKCHFGHLAPKTSKTGPKIMFFGPKIFLQRNQCPSNKIKKSYIGMGHPNIKKKVVPDRSRTHCWTWLGFSPLVQMYQ